jgi:mannose-6-phosphate isomerase-like protein (cupin superfamily)
MQHHAAVESLAHDARRLVGSRSLPVLTPFLSDWPETTTATRNTPGSSLPVLRWLTQIAGDDHGFAVSLIADLCRIAGSLAWRQTYTANQIDAAFLQNYGWTELMGQRAPIDASRVACGFLLLGPGTLYPRHGHEAEEVYIPLSGTARWQQGDAEWRDKAPGTLIHHARNEPHAMRTGAEPLLALYVWRGEQLNQKARLETESMNQ